MKKLSIYILLFLLAGCSSRVLDNNQKTLTDVNQASDQAKFKKVGFNSEDDYEKYLGYFKKNKCKEANFLTFENGLYRNLCEVLKNNGIKDNDDVYREYKIASAKARDLQRINSIQQIRTGLQMYYNDSRTYPETLGNSLTYKGHSYMLTIPQSPEPADGNCKIEENVFVYKFIKEKNSYNIAYCIGQDLVYINGKMLKAGMHYAVPDNFPN